MLPKKDTSAWMAGYTLEQNGLTEGLTHGSHLTEFIDVASYFLECLYHVLYVFGGHVGMA